MAILHQSQVTPGDIGVYRYYSDVACERINFAFIATALIDPQITEIEEVILIRKASVFAFPLVWAF